MQHLLPLKLMEICSLKTTFSFIAKQVMDITKNSHLGRPYLVPNPRIKEVMDSIWSNFRPNTGDIVTRYAINNENQYRYINYSADKLLNK